MEFVQEAQGCFDGASWQGHDDPRLHMVATTDLNTNQRGGDRHLPQTRDYYEIMFTWRSLPERKVLSKFDKSFRELNTIKSDVKRHMGRLNALRGEYINWFTRKRQSFMDVIKTVQLSVPRLVPVDIYTLKNFRRIHEMCRHLKQAGKVRAGLNIELLDQFLVYWKAFGALKSEGDKIVYQRVCDYCDSIGRLRQPFLKDTIDDLQEELTRELAEDFNFSRIHNERDNLFTYRLGVSESGNFQGLMGYIPYLLDKSTKICYLVGKLHLEKEL